MGVAFGDQRAEEGILAVRIAGLQGLRRRDELLAEVRVDVLVHEDALRLDAALAGLVEGAEDDALHGVVEVRVRDRRCTAALPPSSSAIFFFPARAFRSQPTSGLPVKVSSLRRGSSQKARAPSRGQGRIEKAPFGRFVSARTSPMISAPMGVRLAGLSTKGQPAAMAGAILCAARFSGKLKGEMNEHGPMGTRLEKPR